MALSALIETFEEAFPDRVRGYYVQGSVADETSIGTSDMDLDVVVNGTFRHAGERARFIETAKRAFGEFGAL